MVEKGRDGKGRGGGDVREGGGKGRALSKLTLVYLVCPGRLDICEFKGLGTIIDGLLGSLRLN